MAGTGAENGSPAKPELKNIIETLRMMMSHPKQRAKKIPEETIRNFTNDWKSKPEWFSGTLLACLGNNLVQLKNLIEDPTVKEVSWKNPWAAARYPVSIKPGVWGEKATIVQAPPVAVDLGADENVTLEDVIGEATNACILQAEIELFQNLTRHLAYRKHGDEMDFIVPKAIYNDLGASIAGSLARDDDLALRDAWAVLGDP